MNFDHSALPPLREVIAAHDLAAKKSLGQNFLLDMNITDKIVRGAGDLSGVTVFEIGPGPGGLTRSLLKSDAKKVIAVEFDPRAVAALQDLKVAANGRLEIIHGDAMDIDLCALADGPRAIVANLPYNIATPLLVGWLKQIRGDTAAFKMMVLMFQKEVGGRIVAPYGGKAFGRLSVLAQWLCQANVLFDLPPNAFVPPPKVKSSVVRFIPRALESGTANFKDVERITAAAFGQRRKMLRSSLGDYMPVLEDLGIKETLRAENLSVEEFIAIASRAF